MSNRDRSTAFYRTVLAIPLLTVAYLVASGRFTAYFQLFASATRGHGDLAGFDSAFVTGLLWVASLAPLTFAAWELGREHVAARRLNYELLIGVREVWKRARGSREETSTAALQAEFLRPPADKPLVALIWGLTVTLLVPVFFASFMPQLRTAPALVWLVGTGVLLGIAIYSRRRAAAYLRDEPGRWDFFRGWRLLNIDRYEPAARPFVRAQLVVTVVLPIWWLGGGALVMSLSPAN
jgi:hypothetical protein